MEVVNSHVHRKNPNDVYIGRLPPNSPVKSPLANMYSSQVGTLAKYVVKDSETAIRYYKRWFLQQVADKNPEVLAELAKMTPETNLVCFCKPRACHGDVIKEYMEDKWAKESKKEAAMKEIIELGEIQTANENALRGQGIEPTFVDRHGRTHLV